MQSVGKNASYIYLETMVRLFSGFLLWIFLTKISTPQVIGTSSTLISLATIFATVASVGVPLGIPLFLGRIFAENRLQDARIFVYSSLLIVSIGLIASSSLVIVIRDFFYNQFSADLLILSVSLAAFTSIANLFRSIMVASLQLELLPKIMIASSIVMMAIAISLVLLEHGPSGIILAYVCSYALFSILLIFYMSKIFKFTGKASLKLSCSVKSLLKASIPAWIPALITMIGSAELGTIIVFGALGANQAGSYFISYAIFSVIAAVSYSIFSIAFPWLSSLNDGRKRLLWKLLKTSLLLSLPISSSLIFYSDEIMMVIGKDYVQGTAALQLFLISVLPNSVFIALSTLVYSYGNYKQVLVLGLCSSIPRAIFYFVLVLVYGSTGAALSYTLGSFTGFVASIIVAKNIGMILYWKDIIFMLIIPISLSFAFDYIGLNYVIGILCSVGITYTTLYKCRFIKRQDTENVLELLPMGFTETVTNLLNKIGTKQNDVGREGK
jgi:O-antigen/teichoic acid export membrane protein